MTVGELTSSLVLSDIVTLLDPTNDLASLDGTIPLLLYKDMGLQDLLFLFL